MSAPPGGRPLMKLKLNVSKPSTPTESAQTPGPSGLKISFKRPEAPTPSRELPSSAISTASSSSMPAATPTDSVAPKPKRKYTKKPKPEPNGDRPAAAPKQSKKRKSEGAGDNPKPAKRQAKATPIRPANGVNIAPAPAQLTPLIIPSAQSSTSIAPSSRAPPQIQRTPSLSLKLKNHAPAGAPRLRILGAGQPPPRPPGVGYDSEDETIERDPAREEQFILRMAPGPDCDYLRKAIEEKKIGTSLREGGADIKFRFFDREGRRACVRIQDRFYAASLVDLPCIVEGMKSWDKKGWWKSADICQMLLVLGQVQNEETAKTFAIPKEIDQSTWQYAHGLTPPMHWVRKRRFRKRVSYRTIEAVEQEVERLLEADEKAREAGGSSEYRIEDSRDVRSQEDSDHELEYGLPTQMGANDGTVDHWAENAWDEDDVDAFADLLEQGDDEPVPTTEIPGTEDHAHPNGSSPSGAHIAALHALGAEANLELASPSATSPAPSAATESEDDADVDEEDDEIDEDERARLNEIQQLREEVEEIQQDIKAAEEKLPTTTHPLLRKKLLDSISEMKKNLEIKLSELPGEED